MWWRWRWRGVVTECPWMEVEPAAEQTSKASQGPEQHCSILEPHPPRTVSVQDAPSKAKKKKENKTRPLCTTTVIHINKLEMQKKREKEKRRKNKRMDFGGKSAEDSKKNRTGVR